MSSVARCTTPLPVSGATGRPYRNRCSVPAPSLSRATVCTCTAANVTPSTATSRVSNCGAPWRWHPKVTWRAAASTGRESCCYSAGRVTRDERTSWRRMTYTMTRGVAASVRFPNPCRVTPWRSWSRAESWSSKTKTVSPDLFRRGRRQCTGW